MISLEVGGDTEVLEAAGVRSGEPRPVLHLAAGQGPEVKDSAVIEDTA